MQLRVQKQCVDHHSDAVRDYWPRSIFLKNMFQQMFMTQHQIMCTFHFVYTLFWAGFLLFVWYMFSYHILIVVPQLNFSLEIHLLDHHYWHFFQELCLWISLFCPTQINKKRCLPNINDNGLQTSFWQQLLLHHFIWTTTIVIYSFEIVFARFTKFWIYDGFIFYWADLCMK